MEDLSSPDNDLPAALRADGLGAIDCIVEPFDGSSENAYGVVAPFTAEWCSAIAAPPADCRAGSYYYANLEAELSRPASGSSTMTFTAQFRAGLPSQLDRIRAALSGADWPGLRSLIHTLKGTAGSYGFGRLTELSAQVEGELDAQRHGRAAMLCEGLILEARAALLATS